MPGLAELALADDTVKISRALDQAGQKIWGFVVYRCTYEDDNAWERFKTIANARVQQETELSDALDIINSLTFKYFDNRSAFNGASKDHVREHFKHWCASDEAKAEHGDAFRDQETMLFSSPRYTYCIHVDAEALQSVMNGPQPPDVDFDGHGRVNIVDVGWEMPDWETYDYEGDGYERGEIDRTDEGEEPVEGVRLYDVGWMKMGMQSMGVPAFAYLTNPGLWMGAYKRPPEVWVR